MDIDDTGFQTDRDRVLSAMESGAWWTLEGLCDRTGIRYPSSVASRLRDFASVKGSTDAKPKVYAYERRSVPGKKRVYEYRLVESLEFKDQLRLELSEEKSA
jgi:hypothetical protein